MRFDALIVGGGPAGSVAALVLARAGASVVLVEREAFPRRKVCGDFVSGPTWRLLRELGLAAALEPFAGPTVHDVGFWGRDTVTSAPMPGSHVGRAIPRHHLDPALLQEARRAGAIVLQPATVEGVERRDGSFHARLRIGHAGEIDVSAAHAIDAHGSWLPGPFEQAAGHGPHALLGFKATFASAALRARLMPLVIFPGGYGGMVEVAPGIAGFSCCIRRDVLQGLRGGHATAGDAVQAHVARHNRGFREALAGARVESPWQGAGPIRPGIRGGLRDGVLRVGNAAGEAHPIVAEGISMAIQSGWLAATCLAHERGAQAYAREWRANFAPRILAAAAVARIAHHGAGAMCATLAFAPRLLTFGALLSGKARPAPSFATP